MSPGCFHKPGTAPVPIDKLEPMEVRLLLRSVYTRLLGLGLTGAVVTAAQFGALAPVPVRAAGATMDLAAAEMQMYQAVNSDRAQAGLAPLAFNQTLSGMARGDNIVICGQTLHGRSQDMVERNYFSHQIPPCSSYVWPAITATGMNWTNLGENIAWNNQDPSTATDGANTQFMNSPEHKANIDGDFNQVGIGVYQAPGAYTSNGVTYQGVIMFTQIFAKAPVTGTTRVIPPGGTLIQAAAIRTCAGVTCILRDSGLGSTPVAAPAHRLVAMTPASSHPAARVPSTPAPAAPAPAAPGPAASHEAASAPALYAGPSHAGPRMHLL